MNESMIKRTDGIKRADGIRGLHQAEQEADRIRSELLRTLNELDRRRHEATDWQSQLRSNWGLLAAAAGVVGAIIAARLLLGRFSEKRRARNLRHERIAALRRFWEHPERLAPVRHSGPVEWGTSALGIFGNAVATRMSRKIAERVVG
jgi:hypothetical protein